MEDSFKRQLASFFCRRWVREYLPTSTRRTKWFTPVEQIEKGDVIVIENPTNCWMKGVVIDTIVGKSYQARLSTIQISSGVLISAMRATIKLFIMFATGSK